MLSTYTTAELIAKWGKVNSPDLNQMIGYMLQNQLDEETRRNQNDRDLIFQQQVIEELTGTVSLLADENETLKGQLNHVKDELSDLKAEVEALKENGQE